MGSERDTCHNILLSCDNILANYTQILEICHKEDEVVCGTHRAKEGSGVVCSRKAELLRKVKPMFERFCKKRNRIVSCIFLVLETDRVTALLLQMHQL